MARRESRELAKTEPVSRLPISRDMDRWFEDFFRRPFASMPRVWTETDEFSPAIDVYEEGSDVVVKAELPGMKKEDIEISLTEDILTLSGEKKTEKKVEKKDYHRYESTYGSFCRTIGLPSDVKRDQVKASFKDGVLEIRMPKTDEARKKETRIKIE